MTLKLGARRIGPGEPVFVIAEACDNHLGSLEVAKTMVRMAKLAGADAIKFQHHLPDEEMLPEVPRSANFDEDQPLYEFLKRHALTLDAHRVLKGYCESLGILYLCTPFSYRAAQELQGLGVVAFKIGSGEMTDLPSLRRIAAFGKPMLLSTGMSTLEEIDETIHALTQAEATFGLLHCVSEYPPRYDDMNLGVITLLKQRYPHLVIGHSDHTPDLYTAFAAVALGASIIEKHVTLDTLQRGPDQAVSIDMMALKTLVDGIRKIERSLGCVKQVHALERPIRAWAFRSVVSTRPLAAGERITNDAVWTKRPGTGIPAKQLPELIGKRVKRNLPANTLLSWNDLE
ncbi:MAG: N-acetylneuraminate synthase family protein [Candidatus Omnitrophica bacterium]|nr:N-acetylneuraminate synthase family protein [Candidatus Omnitrophota bacterium]